MQCHQRLAHRPGAGAAPRALNAPTKTYLRTVCTRTAASATSTTTQQHQQLNVVITGSSKGLGFAMAHEFLQAGDNVVLCGRGADRLAAALQHLQQHSALRPGQVQGLQCDVSDAADVEQLTNFVHKKLGTVDRNSLPEPVMLGSTACWAADGTTL
eukprot:GHRQ01028386.1.p1 GENE.GHRQ01028386.1~~GHRQ01028386.1.p1  ORF type:complete len:156 (+),score=44.42 GHRQ01028386.1:97-564(+)